MTAKLRFSTDRRRVAPRQSPRLINRLQTSTVREATQMLDGLLSRDAHIDCKYFHDAVGTLLLSAIAELDEYYLARTEETVFRLHRNSIIRVLPRSCQVVDLACGNDLRSHCLLHALDPQRYIGIDFSELSLRRTMELAAREFPDTRMVGIAADLSHRLEIRPILEECRELPPVFLCPGACLCNLYPAAMLRLLRELRTMCGARGRLVAGVLRPNNRERLEAACNDPIGATAAYNLNVLNVANRRLAANFNPRFFEHRARFNPVEGRVEFHLVSRCAQTITFGTPRAAEREFLEGEQIRTRLTYTYEPEAFANLLEHAGFSRWNSFPDFNGDFCAFVAEP